MPSPVKVSVFTAMVSPVTILSAVTARTPVLALYVALVMVGGGV